MKPRLSRLITALALSLLCSTSWAADYPNRPLRLIVPAAVGGAADVLARIVGKELAVALGQSVVVENKPGAAGIVGTTVLARSTPDGYTIGMLFTGALSINPSLYKGLPYNAGKDFAPVTMIAISPLVLSVGESIKADTLKAFIATAKENPGKFTYGSAGIGSTQHLSMELLDSLAGVDLLHVPYKGSAAALTDMRSGLVSMMVENAMTVLPFIKDGQFRPLAVTTDMRLDALPNVPTVAESGFPGFDTSSWYGLVAPAGVDPAIIDKLNTIVRQAMTNPTLVTALQEQGMIPRTGSPAEFTEYIEHEKKRWAAVITTAKIPMQDIR